MQLCKYIVGYTIHDFATCTYVRCVAYARCDAVMGYAAYGEHSVHVVYCIYLLPLHAVHVALPLAGERSLNCACFARGGAVQLLRVV